MADYDGAVQQARDLERVIDVIVDRHFPDVPHRAAIVVSAQIDCVAFVAVARQQSLIRFPVPQVGPVRPSTYQMSARIGNKTVAGGVLKG